MFICRYKMSKLIYNEQMLMKENLCIYMAVFLELKEKTNFFLIKGSTLRGRVGLRNSTLNNTEMKKSVIE